MICKSRDLADSDFIISLILDELNQILHKDLAASNPVSLGGMRWKWISPSLRDESALQKAESHFLVSWFRTFLRSLIVNMSLKLNIRLGPFLPEKYKSEIVLNSDFKKFDEMLRMVIDCSEDQTKAIENLLAEYLRMNKIFYGLHKSSEALMTCMVFSASENQHVHFIDGGQGGYTLAALEMKKQIAAQ